MHDAHLRHDNHVGLPNDEGGTSTHKSTDAQTRRAIPADLKRYVCVSSDPLSRFSSQYGNCKMNRERNLIGLEIVAITLEFQFGSRILTKISGILKQGLNKGGLVQTPLQRVFSFSVRMKREEGGYKKRGGDPPFPQMCTLGLSGCRLKPRRLLPPGFTRQPERTPNAHV